MKTETLGIICMIIYEALLGVTPLLYKYIDVSISSSIIVAARYTFASILLGIWFLSTGQHKQKKPVWSSKRIAGAIFLGVLGSGVAGWLNAVGVRTIGVILGTLLTNLEIPIGVLLGCVVLKEKLSRKYLTIFVVIVAGYALLIAKNGIELPVENSYTLGVGVALGAAVIWGTSTIVGKRLTRHLTSTVLSFWRVFLGSITAGIIAWIGGDNVMAVSSIHWFDWLLICALGAISASGLLLYYIALKRLTVGHISLFFPLSAVISVILGYITGEVPLVSQWIGIFFILGGIMYFFMQKGRHAI